jgi:hypothetical protein
MMRNYWLIALRNLLQGPLHFLMNSLSQVVCTAAVSSFKPE